MLDFGLGHRSLLALNERSLSRSESEPSSPRRNGSASWHTQITPTHLLQMLIMAT